MHVSLVSYTDQPKCRRKGGQQRLCEVCNDCATGYHFNAMTCEGCKGFFRRTIKQRKVYACSFKNQCKIEKGNRRQCQACRLQKCLGIGMKKECIMTDAEIEQKRKLVFLNRLKRNNQKPTEMSEEDHRIIQSVDEAYYRTKCDQETIVQENGSLGKMDELLNSFVDLFPQQSPKKSPSVIKKVNDDGMIEEVDLIRVNFVKLMHQCVREIISFAKDLPGFAMLTDHDKKCLLRGGIAELLHLKLNLFYNTDAEMFTVMSDDACCYGNREEKYSLVHLFHKNMKHFSSDERITSMMCAIALFSPDREGLVEHKKIEKFQHYFTCVLQNYIQGAKKEKISTFANIIGMLTTVRDVTSIMNRR